VSFERAVADWLEDLGLRDVGDTRAAIQHAIVRSGVDPAVATAVATIPRHPFAPSANWRLAYALGIEHPLLPSPRRMARLLQALSLRPGERLLVAEPAFGWVTLVAGVLGRLTGAGVQAVALPHTGRRSLGAIVDALQLTPATARHYDAILAGHSPSTPAPSLQALLKPRGRLVWTMIPPAREARIQRLELIEGHWQCLDLGPAVEQEWRSWTG
jgi:protein-L-isoaspartate O-methyltransferase